MSVCEQRRIIPGPPEHFDTREEEIGWLRIHIRALTKTLAKIDTTDTDMELGIRIAAMRATLRTWEARLHELEPENEQ